MLPPDGGPEFNRLIHEKSPYLLQHARNPVDWYPWGEDALARANDENKPIFLSVGYSTCHWCHVMERESFEMEDVAEVLNEHFICIKVDREERPDIDEVYMNATQLMTGRGGWPNSVWLTPDGRPWYAGTYFPPDQPGRPGFKALLLNMAEIWRTRREDVEQQADQLAEGIRRMSSDHGQTEGGELSRDLVDQAIAELGRSFDERWGGFGGAPKFPPHAALPLLMYQYSQTEDDSLLKMVRRTLDAMADGGIRDHVGGGFHRYSTDERWFLPHFEKMLYDNAELLRTYVDGYLVTGDDEYRGIAVEICEWVLREMVGPAGGFYSALDADSEGEEGKFYVWRYEEILNILGKEDGELFCRIYGVEEKGNFRDEARGEWPGTNVLHLRQSLSRIAEAEGIPLEALGIRLAAARKKLLNVRNQRIRPALDDKVLMSWNGLMIGSLAYAGRHLKSSEYVAAAERGAQFLLSLRGEDGRLRRSYREGDARLNAYLDDYAFLADGLLDLHDATGKTEYLNAAKRLAEILIRHHLDRTAGGFYFTSDDHEDLLIRSKDPFDRAIPSGNGIVARVLVRLGHHTEEQRYMELARETLEAFLSTMERAPQATGSLVLSMAMYLDETAATGAVADKMAPAARIRKKPVTIEAFTSQEKTPRGTAVDVDLRIKIDDGWHINSSYPQQDYLIPTRVVLENNPIATLGEIVYPEGKEVRLGFNPEPVSVYEGEVTIRVPVLVAAESETGATDVPLTVRLQPCDDSRCLAPEKITLSVPIEVTP